MFITLICNLYPQSLRWNPKMMLSSKGISFSGWFLISMLNLRGSYSRGRLHGSAFSGAYQRPSQQALAILWPGGRSLWLLCPPPTLQFRGISGMHLVTMVHAWNSEPQPGSIDNVHTVYVYIYKYDITTPGSHLQASQQGLATFLFHLNSLSFRVQTFETVCTWKSRDSSLGYFNL